MNKAIVTVEIPESEYPTDEKNELIEDLVALCIMAFEEGMDIDDIRHCAWAASYAAATIKENPVN